MRTLLTQIRRLAEQDAGLAIVREDEAMVDFSKHLNELRYKFDIRYMTHRPVARYYRIARQLLQKHSVAFTPCREVAYDNMVRREIEYYCD